MSQDGAVKIWQRTNAPAATSLSKTIVTDMSPIQVSIPVPVTCVNIFNSR